MLFVDLHGFKRVNDDLGHRVGDVMLAEVGPRIETMYRAKTTGRGRAAFTGDPA